MQWLLFLLCATFIVSGCMTSEKMPSTMPDDFNFSLQYGFEAKNELNTFDSTYTKDLIETGEIMTEFKLTSGELEALYDEMVHAEILTTPNNVSDPCVAPHETNKMSLLLDGETYDFDWVTSECPKAADQKLKQFTDFLHHEIVTNRTEYKELPDVVGGYD